MTAPSRQAAHQVLWDVQTGSADLPHALARARHSLDDPRDRSLTTEIVTGTLRWQAALDHRIAQLTSRPLQRLDEDILVLLRAGTYQLLHLTRVPSHAVVNDAVALTKTIGKRSASSLVNAVLRSVASRGRSLRLPMRPETNPNTWLKTDRQQALDYLNITLSHPRWLVERWLDREGFETTERWASFNNKPAPIALAVNKLIATRTSLAAELETHGVLTRPGRWSTDALIVTEGNPLLTPLASQGSFLIQDEASQLVSTIVTATPGSRVLDACASPGMKTVAIAGTLEGRGLIAAADHRPPRVSLLSETLARCRVSCAHVVRLDSRRQMPFGTLFDWVLLDVPCSGLGTIRRDPDIRWRRKAAELLERKVEQSAMLAAAADVVRPGGWLVYATCSSEPEENEEVVNNFLTTRADFVASPIEVSALTPFINHLGYFQTRPAIHELDAFFAAKMQRRIL